MRILTMIARRWRGLLAPLALLFAVAAPAAETDDEALVRILSAVVGVRAEIAPDARTAGALGLRRSGSGIVIDANGLVVTVGYVILEATRVLVAPRPGEGPELEADVVAYDHDTGFGLLRARGDLGVRPMPLGDSAALARGSPVVIASYGGAQMARPSLVVDRRAYAGYWEYLLDNAIFATPPHPLFGGAALIDPAGRLVGVGSLIVPDAAGPGRAVVGNVFIPVDLLKSSMGRLLTNTRDTDAIRPWLGLYTEESDDKLRVTRLATDGPALRAGVRAGEQVEAIDGAAVGSMIEFYRKLWSGRRAGDRITLTLRDADGAVRDVEITSMDRLDWLRL